MFKISGLCSAIAFNTSFGSVAILTPADAKAFVTGTSTTLPAVSIIFPVAWSIVTIVLTSSPVTGSGTAQYAVDGAPPKPGTMLSALATHF